MMQVKAALKDNQKDTKRVLLTIFVLFYRQISCSSNGDPECADSGARQAEVREGKSCPKISVSTGTALIFGLNETL